MYKLLLGIFLLISIQGIAQIPGGGRPTGSQNMNMGRFYGRIVDAKTNKILQQHLYSLSKAKWIQQPKNGKRWLFPDSLLKPTEISIWKTCQLWGNSNLK
jgi:hypothetical protein